MPITGTYVSIAERVTGLRYVNNAYPSSGLPGTFEPLQTTHGCRFRSLRSLQ